VLRFLFSWICRFDFFMIEKRNSKKQNTKWKNKKGKKQHRFCLFFFFHQRKLKEQIEDEAWLDDPRANKWSSYRCSDKWQVAISKLKSIFSEKNEFSFSMFRNSFFMFETNWTKWTFFLKRLKIQKLFWFFVLFEILFDFMDNEKKWKNWKNLSEWAKMLYFSCLLFLICFDFLFFWFFE